MATPAPPTEYFCRYELKEPEVLCTLCGKRLYKRENTVCSDCGFILSCQWYHDPNHKK